MDNRRQKRRYRARLKGHLWFEGQKVSVETVNLSESGVRITLDMPLLEGSDVRLHLDVSPNGVMKVEPIVANGVVVWCQEDIEVGYQAGIRFVTLSTDHVNYLSHSLPSYPPA